MDQLLTYKRGDVRADGFICDGPRTYKDGTIGYKWCNPESFARRNEMSRTWAARNPEKEIRRNEARKHKKPRKTTMLYLSAKARAEKRGLEFTLTREWVQQKVDAGFCEVSGIPFSISDGHAYRRPHDFSPSIDKIDPKKGYTPENCQMVVWIYNRAKGDTSHENLMSLAKALVVRFNN